MNITTLDTENQAAALAFLRSSPYRNALPLSNVGQLRAHCDVLVAAQGGRVVGVMSFYRDLPILNLTFAARQREVAVALLHELAERQPRFRSEPFYALLPAQRYAWLSQYVAVQESEIEFQMVVEPEVLRVPASPVARRLGEADLPAMSALAEAAGLSVWHDGTLALGPAFGCFVADRLVSMAATHFATPEIVEIGHIATHPEFRQRGYASACTAALASAAFALAPRVFLMVLEHNLPALTTYQRLGFRSMERFHLTRFAPYS
ncbi:MAG TPA: GNAT family N-acetyltransferase [Roseiflexaceae bacterium]|jgi:ribosomal protein S18 acetylase RimI-like enzyme|nr:GNAT family N-acetyltransferase [Roseiflexaceae bacterium]